MEDGDVIDAMVSGTNTCKTHCCTSKSTDPENEIASVACIAITLDIMGAYILAGTIICRSHKRAEELLTGTEDPQYLVTDV